MTPGDLLHQLASRFGDRVPADLDPASVSFVTDDDLLYTSSDVITHRSKLRRGEPSPFWTELLDQPRSWVHVNLLLDAGGNAVVAVRAGPRASPRPGVETPLAISVERLPLRVLE